MAKKHGHHGGAWKVAYADFVTAMMALFLVLWLTSQDEKIKEAVQRSFRNPFVSLTKESTGVVPNKDVQAVKNTQGNFDSASMVELNMLRKLSQDLIKTLATNPETPDDDPFKLETTPDGVRINVFGKTEHPIFKPDSAEFTPEGNFIFSTLAWQVARYTNSFLVELEGHAARSAPEKRTNDLADDRAWELTSARAQAARKLLIKHGALPGQIRKVAGFGETVPMVDTAPENPKNNRVAVLLRTSQAKE